MQFIELLETGTPNIDFSGHSENTFRIIDFSVPPTAYGKFMSTIFMQWVKNDVGEIFIRQFESLYHTPRNRVPRCQGVLQHRHERVPDDPGLCTSKVYTTEPDRFWGRRAQRLRTVCTQRLANVRDKLDSSDHARTLVPPGRTHSPRSMCTVYGFHFGSRLRRHASSQNTIENPCDHARVGPDPWCQAGCKSDRHPGDQECSNLPVMMLRSVTDCARWQWPKTTYPLRRISRCFCATCFATLHP